MNETKMQCKSVEEFEKFLFKNCKIQIILAWSGQSDICGIKFVVLLKSTESGKLRGQYNTISYKWYTYIHRSHSCKQSISGVWS